MSIRIKKTFLLTAGIISAMFLILMLSHSAKARRIQADLSDHILRLHILAVSDDENDQKNKLLVRDAVLNQMAPYMSGVSSKEEAISVISSHMNEIERTAADTLRALGDENDVSVSLSRDYFPVKTYDDLTFPAGEYDALRICIGNAQGQNWWCVMYPTLCFIDASTVSFPDDSLNTLRNDLEEDTYESLFSEDTSQKPIFRFKYLTFLNFIFE